MNRELDMLEFTGITGKPPSPSSTDGHLPLLRLSSVSVLVPHHRTRLAAEDARRLRSPYRVRLSARTGRP